MTFQEFIDYIRDCLSLILSVEKERVVVIHKGMQNNSIYIKIAGIGSSSPLPIAQGNLSYQGTVDKALKTKYIHLCQGLVHGNDIKKLHTCMGNYPI